MSNIFSYLNPSEKLYGLLDYNTNKKVILILIVYTGAILSVLAALIFSRNKKKLSITG